MQRDIGRETDGTGPADLGDAGSAVEANGSHLHKVLDGVEHHFRRASRGDIEDIDVDKLEDILGPEARETLDQLKQFLEILEEAGYIRKKGNGFELTPRGTRKIGQRALAEIYRQLKKDTFGKHETKDSGHGGDRRWRVDRRRTARAVHRRRFRPSAAQGGET
mgnify:CR=1 FL=1